MTDELQRWPGAGLGARPPAGGTLLFVSDDRTYEVANGVLRNVHRRDACAGEPCCIHNPSDHHMRDWPQMWRDDRGMMERRCQHGIGHPDPDDPFSDTVHGCDGCCAAPVVP
jgi:hypothetical protein